MNYNTLCWKEPNTQYFMLATHHSLILQVVKYQDLVVYYGKNQATINNDTRSVYAESYLDKVCAKWIDPYICYEYIKPACVNFKKRENQYQL